MQQQISVIKYYIYNVVSEAHPSTMLYQTLTPLQCCIRTSPVYNVVSEPHPSTMLYQTLTPL